MNRRKFIGQSTLLGIGGLFFPKMINASNLNSTPSVSQAKNIIFMVSDGMSNGTLSMANQLHHLLHGKSSQWIQLYEENKVKRSLMDTASLNSLITDSAAGGSAWGGGHRVENGKINVGPNGEKYLPILQKFKKAGKSVGCVTTVPITHATPASFCVMNEHRSGQEAIAEEYLRLKFDVMLGGGNNYFNKGKRADKKDLYQAFEDEQFLVLRDLPSLQNAKKTNKPVIGVFADDALPYKIDRTTKENNSPSLTDLTSFALDQLSQNPTGFFLQIEAGKVDWAAHANDTSALLYDQLEFDNVIQQVIQFAEKNRDTLVVITTDHGNANPGLFYGEKSVKNFEKLLSVKQSNEWIFKGYTSELTPKQLIERIEYASNVLLTNDEATHLIQLIKENRTDGVYNPYKFPFQQLAKYQSTHTSIGWAGKDHSSDHVELCMFGPGSEQLPAFIRNYEIHNYLLTISGLPIN
jgi:alkaline phosphatase